MFHILTLLQGLLLAATFQSPLLNFNFDDTKWEQLVAKPTEREAVDAKMQGQTLVTLQRRNADEKYRARISVVTDAVTKAKPDAGESSLSAYTKYSQGFLKGQRFSVLDSRTVKLNGLGVEATDSVLYQRDFGLKFRQVIFIKGEQAFLVTFTSRLKPYDDYVSEVETLLKSLRFSGAAAKADS